MTALADPFSKFRLDGKVPSLPAAAVASGARQPPPWQGAGAAVAILDIHPMCAEAAAREITSGGGVASAHQADVTEKISVKRAVDAVAARHGRLDILVNSAGTGIPRNVAADGKVETCETDAAPLLRAGWVRGRRVPPQQEAAVRSDDASECVVTVWLTSPPRRRHALR
jgi:NAD(P)-dependent dehydrogenase (short-subunit alcohol dehydrogenase family)